MTSDEIKKIVEQIEIEYNNYKDSIKTVSDVETFFRNSTISLKKRINLIIQNGRSEEEALKVVLPQAYALVKLAIEYTLQKKLYDVQLIGGIYLNEGCIAEMATGEGKTITAALPAYLNALLGKGVHVVTPNTYLASRDYQELRTVYEMLGLSCGLIEEINPSNNREKIQKKYQDKIKKLPSISEGNQNETLSRLRKEAEEEVRIEDIKKRQEQYRCDIVYGSSSAFAFDRLFDDLETNPDLIRRRAEKTHFVLVDEADIVLIDDAVTPFVLSGTQTDEEGNIQENIKEREKVVNLAARVLSLIEEEDRRLKSHFVISSLMIQDGYRENLSTDGLIFEVDDINLFNKMKLDKEKELKKYSSTQALYLCKRKKEFHITPVGYACIFLVFKEDLVNQILNANKDKIIKTKYDGEPLFIEGLDYDFDENGMIKVYPRAFSYLLEAGIIPELSDEYNNYMIGEYPKQSEDIDNAIRAWELLKKDVDYIYTIPPDAKDVDWERSISLVLNGRIAEGRVYSKGLQQAVEAKERIKQKDTDIEIRSSKLNDTLISIPVASFFGTYEKFSGMTGTSSKETISELYGLDTYEVPRNKTKRVIDHGDVLFITKEDKYQAILEEVLISHKKGQPVLITTTSVEESNELHRFLLEQLKKEGIDIEIPVLNANVDKLSEEAKIIANAGKKGAITISTEMAGRGTDIKLGGEILTLEQEIKKELDNMVIKSIIGIKPQSKLEYLMIRKNLEKDTNLVNEIRKSAENNYNRNKAIKEKEEAEISEAGGLKVIGSGHFIYRRTDKQVKGRCGRQGNVGEIIFFSDLDDLDRIGVSHDKIAQLERRITETGKPIDDDDDTYGKLLEKYIFDAQSENERRVKDNIYYSQRIENAVAICRSHLRGHIERIKRDNDYKQHLKYMVEDIAYEMVISSAVYLSYADLEVDDTNKVKASTKRIDSIMLNYDQLIELVDEFFGEKVEKDTIKSFVTVGDFVEFLCKKTETKIERAFTSGEENIKTMVDKKLNSTWLIFEEILEDIKFQQSMAALSNANPLDNLESSIEDGYIYCFESMLAQIVREVLNPNYKDKHFGLTEFTINDDASTRRISHDEYSKRKSLETIMTVEEDLPVTNLSIRPLFREVAMERMSLTKQAAEKLNKGHGKK